MKRTAIVTIRRTTFVDVLNGRAEIEMPQDSRIVNIRLAWELDGVDLLVESPDFEEVSEGAMSPYRSLGVRYHEAAAPA